MTKITQTNIKEGLYKPTKSIYFAGVFESGKLIILENGDAMPEMVHNGEKHCDVKDIIEEYASGEYTTKSAIELITDRANEFFNFD